MRTKQEIEANLESTRKILEEKRALLTNDSDFTPDSLMYCRKHRKRYRELEYNICCLQQYANALTWALVLTNNK